MNNTAGLKQVVQQKEVCGLLNLCAKSSHGLISMSLLFLGVCLGVSVPGPYTSYGDAGSGETLRSSLYPP